VRITRVLGNETGLLRGHRAHARDMRASAQRVRNSLIRRRETRDARRDDDHENTTRITREHAHETRASSAFAKKDWRALAIKD